MARVFRMLMSLQKGGSGVGGVGGSLEDGLHMHRVASGESTDSLGLMGLVGLGRSVTLNRRR